MKHLIFISIFSISSAISIAHAAGTGVTGGGSTVVCRDPNTNAIIGQPQLYDLFEAQHDPRRAYKIVRSEENADAQIEAMVKNFEANAIPAEDLEGVTLRNSLAVEARDWLFTDGEARINMEPDFMPRFLPKDPHCKVEVTASYDDASSVLEVDKEIYEKMSNTDKAALRLHEAVYKINRIFAKDKTSDRTRQMVADLVKGGSMPGLYQSLETIRIDPKNMPFKDPRVIEIIFGQKTLVCKDQSGHELLAIQSDGSIAEDHNTELNWDNQYFYVDATLAKKQPPTLDKFPIGMVVFSGGGDSFGANLKMSLEDLYFGLATKDRRPMHVRYYPDKGMLPSDMGTLPKGEMLCQFE
jgi:hypothetical protein